MAHSEAEGILCSLSSDLCIIIGLHVVSSYVLVTLQLVTIYHSEI
jgi:hypothetical protein